MISNPIYLTIFSNHYIDFISPFLAIWGLAWLMRLGASSYFVTGFFVGVLWFWWVGLSAIHFDLDFLVPFIILGFGLFYGFCFRIIYIFKYDFLKLLAIFGLSFIRPLGFDWFNFGIFVNFGFFDASYRGILAIFLIAYLINLNIKKTHKTILILFSFFIALQYKDPAIKELDFDFKLINTQVPQDQKYFTNNIISNADFAIKEIKKAIKEKKELIILPESTFAFDLENNTKYMDILKNLSKNIIIITGAFSQKNANIYNSTYIFDNTEFKILNKHFLVPFGEEIPIFKNLIKNYINISEFNKGDKLNQYTLKDQSITNAICYEVTKEEIYKNSKTIIAISNNAWFDGVIQPNLQRLLIQFYANKYKVVVYHATNGEKTSTIKPKKSIITNILKLIK